MRIFKKNKKIQLTREELQTIVSTAVKEAVSSTAFKLDVGDLVEQLSKPPVSTAVRKYFTWEYRLVDLIRERSRRAARDTFDFVDKEMRGALYTANQFDVIKSRRDEIVTLNGAILDLGVYKGASTRALANIFPEREIHGFDSFDGLPEDWSHVLKGGFGGVKGELPAVPDNVILHKGWFSDTLQPWAREHDSRPISLLRVDCDIYSSTKTIFGALGHLLKPGSWICFDELIGYYGWQEHEYKAFMEFIAETGFTYEYIAYGLTYTLVKLTSRT